MKNKVNLLYFILLAPILLSAQNFVDGQVSYSASFSDNSLNKDSDINELFKKTIEYIPSLNYTLFFKNNLSHFSLDKGLASDFEDNIYLKSAIKIVGDAKIFIDLDANLKLLQKEFLGDMFLISDTTKLNWTILKETKVISKYKCFKAVLNIKNNLNPNGIKIVAWFTHEIPVSFGPKGYYGLPGLIIELSENNLKFFANRISLKKIQSPINEPKKGISISHKDYIEYVNKKINDFTFKN